MKLSLLILAVAAALALSACSDSSDVPGVEPTGSIYFTTDRDGNFEVYVMAVGGSGAVNVSNDPASDGSASLNPDGLRIAFISDRGGWFDIWVMDTSGGGAEQITNDPAIDGSPFWSPDGTTIAHFSARDGSRGNLWVTDVESAASGSLLDTIMPSTPEVACSGGTPGGWLADDTVLYQGSQGDIAATQICSVKLSGSDITVLFSEPGVASFQPSISPDGERLAFASSRDGQLEIYVVGRNGSGLRRLTFDPGRDSDPVWSPDGEWLAFTSEADGDAEIFIIRPDGTGLRQLTENDGVSDNLPFWVP